MLRSYSLRDSNETQAPRIAFLGIRGGWSPAMDDAGSSAAQEALADADRRRSGLESVTLAGWNAPAKIRLRFVGPLQSGKARFQLTSGPSRLFDIGLVDSQALVRFDVADQAADASIVKIAARAG